jgi:ketosteroid isomerase-like protein
MTDEERIAQLEARLQLLEDKEELRSLRDAYHACINDGRYGDIAELFSDDAVVELGYLARYAGRNEIDTGFRGMAERERFFIKQFIHSHSVEVAGDSASGRSYLEARYGRYGVSYLVSGRYDDTYRRVDGVWRFSRMAIDFYYTVPAGVGWTGDDLHYLDRR